MTQLSFDDLMIEPSALTYERYAKVENITIPFEWERVDYLLGLESVDFPDDGPGALRNVRNQQSKRRDVQYESLLEDLKDQGYLDPIFVYPPESRIWGNKEEVLGNGHHRLVAALDLGYTFVPVTRDPDEQWRTSGSD